MSIDYNMRGNPSAALALDDLDGLRQSTTHPLPSPQYGGGTGRVQSPNDTHQYLNMNSQTGAQQN